MFGALELKLPTWRSLQTLVLKWLRGAVWGFCEHKSVLSRGGLSKTVWVTPTQCSLPACWRKGLERKIGRHIGGQLGKNSLGGAWAHKTKKWQVCLNV